MGYVFDAIQNPSDGDEANDALIKQVFGDAELPPMDDARPKASKAPATDPAPPAPAPRQSPSESANRQVVPAQFDERLVVASSPSSGQAEAFRRLASRVFAAANNEPAVHAVTSACRKDGKTLTCLNLAMAMGELTERGTVLVEGDLRAANIIRMCRVSQMPPGLFQLLAGECTLDEALIWPEGSNIPIIYAGTRADDRAPSLVNSHRLAEVIQQLRERFEQVVIDTPPILDVSDTSALCTVADQVLLVARMNQTDRDLVHEALNTVRSYNRNVAGLVLTDVKPHAMPYGRRYRNGYYGYGYGYGHSSSKKRSRRGTHDAAELTTADAA